MVKLTTKYLFLNISKKNHIQPRRKDEPDLEYLNRISHLYLQNQFIDKIAPLPQCRSVSVIYLQHNKIQRIQNLETFASLTHLCLQHNYISKIENLTTLSSLKKLYLGYNEISVVEGLENLKKLTELHLESQRLPQGETLYFDPRTIFHLSKCLKVLNISNNNITSILCLSDLTMLTKLLVDRNWIRDLEDVTETLSCLPYLEEFSSEGNPVALHRKYLDAIVVASKSLKTLNGKAIDERTRVFITNLASNRDYRKKLSEFSTYVINSDSNFSNSQEIAEDIQYLKPRLGSKLFPLLKKAMDKSKIEKIPSEISGNRFSPVFESSIKVSPMCNSSSFLL